MKNTIIILLIAILAISWNNSTKTNMSDTTPKVTGIGGIFFKCKDPKAVKEWYGKNLGLAINDYGSTFEGKDANHPEIKTYLQWTPFKETTKDFDKELMVNYRVQNLEALVENLKKNGVTIVDTIAKYDYGSFVHILDNEGNKVELWEPNNSHAFGLGETTK
jgi:predicted enzyme related to lactoylglutathione lyase